MISPAKRFILQITCIDLHAIITANEEATILITSFNQFNYLISFELTNMKSFLLQLRTSRNISQGNGVETENTVPI